MKNHKKSDKQLKHLQAIYNLPQDGEGIEAKTTISGSGVLGLSQNKHTIIKKDLVSLVILIVLIIAALFTLNYLAETTSFGTWMNNLIGKII